MKSLSGICLGIFLSMPYAILAIIIARYLKQDNFFYWLLIIMLLSGMLCLLLSAILPRIKDKNN